MSFFHGFLALASAWDPQVAPEGCQNKTRWLPKGSNWPPKGDQKETKYVTLNKVTLLGDLGGAPGYQMAPKGGQIAAKSKSNGSQKGPMDHFRVVMENFP